MVTTVAPIETPGRLLLSIPSVSTTSNTTKVHRRARRPPTHRRETVHNYFVLALSWRGQRRTPKPVPLVWLVRR